MQCLLLAPILLLFLGLGVCAVLAIAVLCGCLQHSEFARRAMVRDMAALRKEKDNLEVLLGIEKQWKVGEDAFPSGGSA